MLRFKISAIKYQKFPQSVYQNLVNMNKVVIILKPILELKLLEITECYLFKESSAHANLGLARGCFHYLWPNVKLGPL